MSEQTASSLYMQQYNKSKLPTDAKHDDKQKTKFCLICDTQYCSANDNAKNNWGDAVNMNYNDVKFFCTVFDLPDVQIRDKLPLCPICFGLMSKLIGYKEQVQRTQALFDGLHLQLTTRAIKTCRKYNYNNVRPVNTTVQLIRRNVFRRWNREIGDTSGPTKAFNAAPPKLEPQKPKNRRKSRLVPRTTLKYGALIFHSKLLPANLSPGISGGVPRVNLARPNPDSPTIPQNIEEIDYIDVDDDASLEDSQVANPHLPENVNSEKQEGGNENENTNDDDSIETPGTHKIIKISHSIFEDNFEDMDLNLANLLSINLEELYSEPEEHPTLNPIASSSETDEHKENGNGSQSPLEERPSEKCSVPVVTSARVGARKRKPTLRAVQSSEIMNMISKRRRKTSKTGSTPSGCGITPSGNSPSGTEIPTSSSPSKEKETDPKPEPEIEFEPERPEREASEDESESDKPNLTSGAVPAMFVKDGAQEFPCYRCDKIFMSEKGCKQHYSHIHRQSVCKICNKIFLRKTSLQVHMRIHTGEKPYECIICGLACADKSILMAHLDNHMAKPWTCLLCRKMCALKAFALRHAEVKHPRKSCAEIVISSHDFFVD